MRRLLRDYRSHDSWSQRQLAEYQQAQLAKIIRHAREATHYYPRIAQGMQAGPDSVHHSLAGLPVLEKETLRSAPDELRATAVRGLLEKKTTSGSTGQPVTVWKNRDAIARERAATWRAYGWAGISVAAPQGLLWGQPLTVSGRLRARSLDFLANRLRLSMFGVTESEMEEFHRKLLSFHPKYLYGYVSAISAFVRYLKSVRKNLPDSVAALVTTSELLDDATRAYLTDATGLPVFNEYGCGEVGSIAHDCEHGRLHIMSDNVVLECLPDPALPDDLGHLAVTDLFNLAMPLIRYRLGDLGLLSSEPCPCGRPYPILEKIVGRAYDLIEDADGRTYHPEAVLYAFEKLKRNGVSLPPYQAVQSDRGTLTVYVQSTQPIAPNTTQSIESEIRSAFAARMTVTVRQVPFLERESSGKLRVVKRVR